MMKLALAALLTVAAVVATPVASAGTGHSGKGTSSSPDPRSNAAVVRQIADQIKQHCHHG